MASDYQRMTRAILHLAERAEEQPSLAEAAARVGLSQYHFQRLFTRWVGLSPKRFVQFLTLERAKQLLAERRSVLATSIETGLAGSGRLHDLFVTLEAMTPGEFQRGGAGLEIRHGRHESPLGPYLLAVCAGRGVCGLSFASEAEAVEELRARWPRAELRRDRAATAPVAERLFAGAGQPLAPVSVLIKGTAFQVKVWEALLRIPPGQVATYGEVAAAIGAPSAARAVGGAVGDNAVAVLVPCHRVIRSSGLIGDYRWGASRKRALLAWEAAARAAS